MASTNGSRMWKPASSVARYRPSRSTTNALCCGTTTAVREMTKSASSASTRKTISASDIVASPSLLRLEPERQAVHPRHFAALPAPQRALAFVPRGPRRAAELRLADLARRQVVEQHGHLLIRQRQPLVAYPLQRLQLRTRRVLGLDLADPPEPALELAVAELAAHLRLGDEPVDVVADLVERADVGIRREAVERRLEAEARLGVGEACQHAHAFLAQAENLGVEGDQVVLGTFGLACQLGEIGGQTVDLGGERVATADQRDRGDVVVVLDGDVELAADAGELGRLRRELLPELAPHVEDAGGGMAELLVLDDALADRRLVDGVGVAMLALTHPVGEGTAEKARQSRDDVHGALLHAESLVASSALMPSSRIFCWRFWRCMPMSSAAFVMFPP